MVNDTLLHSVFILGGAQHPMTALADLSKGFLMTKERHHHDVQLVEINR